MKCSDIRETLSARLDGEPGPMPDDLVDRHLGACPDCRGWQAQAAVLRRSMLVREAPRVPDLTERILAAAPVRKRWIGALRVALAAVALTQGGLGIAELLGMDIGHAGHSGMMMAMATHLSNESAAWNVAVGIGLLWAALRPRSAAGLVPVLTGFVVVLGVVSVIDLSDGQVTAGRVLSHSLVAAGVGLLYAVRKQVRRSPVPGPVTADSLSVGDEVELSEAAAAAPPVVARRQFPHRPASRHRAA